MIHFDIHKTFYQFIKKERLILVIHTALEFEKVTDEVEVTLVITGDKQIQELNLEYLGIDAPTDVLSFPSDEIDPDSGFRYIGDIILSYPRAAEQANASGHVVTAELELLIVHAILHLLGYDHADPVGKAKMWSSQASILTQLGTPIKIFPE
jgi:probable rRNA maturation factor